ncbi:MAG: hypothetical protein KC620_24355, partial [Myxococcales bacterium]|nr:hypothetical protein [Myxococcales bacterium]
CPITVRVGATEAASQRVAPYTVTTLPLSQGTGTQHFEVVLAAGTPALASVRFVLDRPVPGQTIAAADGARIIPPLRHRRAFRALAARPVTLVVQGPTAVRLEAWRPLSSPASAIEVRVTPPVGPPEQHRLTLATARERISRSADNRPLRFSETRQTLLLLPAAGVHRIVLAADRGEALLRASARVDAPPAELPRRRPRPIAMAAYAPLDSFPLRLLPPTGVVEPAQVSPFGTFSLRLSFARSLADDADEEVDDAESRRPPNLWELSAAWRRHLPGPRLYLNLGPAVRTPIEQGPVIGGRAAARFEDVVGDLVLNLRLGFFLGTDDEGFAADDTPPWSALGRVSAYYPLRLSPDVSLVPLLGAFIARPAAEPAGVLVDPILTTAYRRDHPRGLRGGLGLRWQALREHHLTARADALTNADFASLDRLDGSLGWDGLFGLSPDATLSGRLRYRPALRFADDDRRETGLTHSFSVGTGASWWLDPGLRLVAGAEFRPFINLGGTFEPRFLLSIGLDWTGGRGLFDFTPIEVPYPLMEGRQFWASPLEDAP